MKKSNKQITVLNIFKIVTLLLICVLLIITIYNKIISIRKDKTNTYLTWCKSAYDNPRDPSWYKKGIIECVKDWKKIEMKIKK